jgi:uncharacterized cupin superfamily protein
MFDAAQATSIAIDLDPVSTEQVVSGSPESGSVVLHDFDGHEVGVWEHTVGVSTDVEASEVFVVLFGRAIVEFGDGRTMELGPGTVGRLAEGQKTVWRVMETLRKVYIA